MMTMTIMIMMITVMMMITIMVTLVTMTTNMTFYNYQGVSSRRLCARLYKPSPISHAPGTLSPISHALITILNLKTMLLLNSLNHHQPGLQVITIFAIVNFKTFSKVTTTTITLHQFNVN